MPEINYTTIIDAPIGVVWDFAQDLSKWSQFVVGYQSHEEISDTEMVWVLKGNIGPLMRTTKFRVLIKERVEKDHISFTLDGVNEPVKGSGFISMRPFDNMVEKHEPESPRQGLLSWLKGMLQRFLRRETVEKVPSCRKRNAENATQVTAYLNMNFAGSAGVIISRYLSPMLKSVAEKLVEGVSTALEKICKPAG